MNKLLLSFLACAATVGCAQAYVLSPEQALQAAKAPENGAPAAVSRIPASAVPALTLSASGQPTLYLFSDSEGCLVASAESQTPALLGYTDAPVAADAELPDGLRYWLDYYSNEIEQLRRGQVVSRRAAQSDFAAVSPILTTTWNQSSPYYNMCPMLGSYRCVTGCVATAMAQAIKVYDWPARGKGSSSYYWHYGGQELSANFEESEYQWNLMLDSYAGPATREERNAVALLMRDCGYSVFMNYSPSASGAGAVYIPHALYNNFDFDRSMHYEERAYFFSDEWEKLVYSDIAEGYPVVYCGSGAAGGHCFVADGYSGDGYFHFNWGWGGVSDGYFRLSALAPGVQGIGGNDDNFNSNQSIVSHLRKPQADSALGISLCAGSAIATQREVYTAGQNVRFGSLNLENYSVEAVSGVLGVKLTPVSGGEPVYLASTTTVSLSTIFGGDYSSSANFRIPADDFPASGTYTVSSALQGTDGVWTDIRTGVNLPMRLLCTIEDGTVTFSDTEGPAQLDVSNLTLTSPVYSGMPFSISFDMTNPGTKDYVGDLILVLYRDDSGVSNTTYFTVDVPAGQSDSRSLITEFLSTVSPGDYTLYMINPFGYIYGEPLDITVQEAPAEVAEAVLTDAVVTDAVSSSDEDGKTVYTVRPDGFTITGTLACTSGFFTSPVSAYVFPVAGGSALAQVGEFTSLLDAGTDTQAIFSCAFPSGKEGDEYMVGFYVRSNPISDDMVYIRIGEPSSVGAVGAAESIAYPQTVYNAQGIAVGRVSSASDVKTLPSGLYIIGGRKVMVP